MYAYGTGKTAEFILNKNKYDISMFIDTYAKYKFFLKKKVVNPNYKYFNFKEKVVVCSLMPESIIEIKNTLQKIGFKKKNIITIDNNSFNIFKFNREELKKLKNIQNKIIKGKSIFNKIIRSRTSDNNSLDDIKKYYLKEIKNLKDEYFEFIDFSKINTFFDVGFYRGDVSKKFIQIKKNKFDKIYAFDVQRVAKKQILKNKKIIFNKFAISNNNKSVFVKKLYDKELPGTFCIKKKKQNFRKQKAISLDEFIKKKKITKVDFVKLDIEGFEINALKGMKYTIKKFTPTIAVAIYHTNKDFYQIPELILEYNKNYKLYFNHYTESRDGSVMYFSNSIL